MKTAQIDLVPLLSLGVAYFVTRLLLTPLQKVFNLLWVQGKPPSPKKLKQKDGPSHKAEAPVFLVGGGGSEGA